MAGIAQQIVTDNRANADASSPFLGHYMTPLTLYEIAQEYRDTCNKLMDMQTDEQTIADTLEGEVWALQIKAQNYGFVIGNLESIAESIKSAELQMTARRNAIEIRTKNLRERLKQAMQIAGVSKFEMPHFEISIAKNPDKVEIFEPALIPAEFMVYAEPPPPSPNKIAIKAAIKNGKEVSGAKLTQGTRLVIK